MKVPGLPYCASDADQKLIEISVAADPASGASQINHLLFGMIGQKVGSVDIVEVVHTTIPYEDTLKLIKLILQLKCAARMREYGEGLTNPATQYIAGLCGLTLVEHHPFPPTWCYHHIK